SSRNNIITRQAQTLWPPLVTRLLSRQPPSGVKQSMVAFIAAFLLRAIDSVVSCPIIAAVLDKCNFCLMGPNDR
ncbi:unnamed protein product, partial [Ectocarpus sp. 4 AP-2014]